MKISVVIPTYKRAWSLPYLLEGLSRQSIQPHEVIFVLKPSGDGSEEVIDRYRGRLNIKVLTQNEGYAPMAYDMGLREASGDVVLFIDDDAIPHGDWVKRYAKLFADLPDAGAIGGLSYKAYLVNGQLRLTDESLFGNESTKKVRKPLKELADYCRYLAISGLLGARRCGDHHNVLLSGINMGVSSEAIRGLELQRAYRESRKGFYFEFYVAYYVVRKGYTSYHVLDPTTAPTVWHIESHRESLTRRSGFWDEFWLQFDRASMFFRLRELGAEVSTKAFLAAHLSLLRRRPLPRLLGTIYAVLYNALKRSA